MSNIKFNNIMLKPGKHTGKIVKAEFKFSQYCKNKNNPKGECLSIWTDVYNTYNQRKRLFDDIPITDRLKLNELLYALDLPTTANVDEIDILEIEGKTVGVIVDVYTSKAGKKSNIVRSYDSLAGETFEKRSTDKSDAPF